MISYVRKFVEVLIITSLVIIVFSKAFLTLSPMNFLFFYGAGVTVVASTTFFIALFLYKDPYKIAVKRNGKLDTSIKASLMVAVHNEEEIIHECVQSMLLQTYENKEIIVVNDASTDNTLSHLREYEERGEIILINIEKNVGKKRALARAMQAATGNIFIFTDSDSKWARDAVEKIMHIFQAFLKVGAVSGHSRALNGDHNLLTKIQDSWYEGQYSIRKAFESYFGAVTCVSGPLAAFRREAIFNYIPAWENDKFLGQEFKFATDRTLTGFVLGGTSVGDKLKKKYSDSHFVKTEDYPARHWKIVYSKAARSWTNVPDTFSHVIKQQVRWKKSFIRNIFFTGTFYWKRPVIPAVIYYLHIIFVLIAPFIVIRHLLYVPIVQHSLLIPLYYLAGIAFVGFMFGLAYKLENPTCHKWIYRPLMSLMSTLVFSWLIFYSAATVKKMVWFRG